MTVLLASPITFSSIVGYLINRASREDPVLDEKGKPTVDPYNRPVTQKMAPRNPMIGQPDLTDAIRGTVLKEVEKGIAEIENILNS